MFERLQALNISKECLTTLRGFKGLILFSIIITVFHLLYKIVEPDVIQLPFIIDILVVLIYPLLSITTWVLNNIFGVHSIVCGDVLCLPNLFNIQMLPGCSGLQQYFLVMALFIIYPGPTQKKLWFIPSAFLVLFILNTLRFIGIALLSANYPSYFQIVHDWVFRPFIYFIIFMLWIIWDTRIYKPAKNKKGDG